MLCKRENQAKQVVESLRGGNGAVGKVNLFGEAALPENLRLAAVLELGPGCSIGRHDHTGEWELFYVLEGQLHGLDCGREIVLCPGDVTLTGGGEVHCLENRGPEAAKVLAVIVR